MLKRMFRPWCGVLTALSLVFCFAAAARAEASRAVVVLDSEGFVHDVVKRTDNRPSVVEQVLGEIALHSGAFEPAFTYDASTVTPEALAAAKLVVLYTTGDLPLSSAALRAWVEQGGAMLGIHCATDTLANDPVYPGLIGGTFDGHPWNAGDTVTIKVHDASHPAAAPYAAAEALRTFKEEIYQYKNFDPKAVRVLISLDMQRTEKKAPRHVPVAWCKEVGKGRVFYTSLGHREDVWRSATYQAHLLGAIGWLLGRREGGAAPNPELHEAETKIAQDAAAGKPAEVKAEGGPERGAGELNAAKPQAGQPGAEGRPRDPWVFRSVLDKNARMVTIALHEDLWVAYDTKDLSLYQAWRGGVELKGAVYDGRHGPQPETKPEQVYFKRSVEQQPLRIEKDGKPVEAKLRYLGHRFENGGVVLMAMLMLPDGHAVEVFERPEHQPRRDGGVGLVRHVEARGVPAGYAVTFNTRGNGGIEEKQDAVNNRISIDRDGSVEDSYFWTKLTATAQAKGDAK